MRTVKGIERVEHALAVGNLVDLVAELGRTVQSLDVPAKMLARHIDPGHLAIMVDHRAVMRCNDVILFVEAGVGPLGFSAPRRHPLPEQPRTATSAPADPTPTSATLPSRGSALARRAEAALDEHRD